MAEERRSAHRANMSGVCVTYESAAGDRLETDALNLGPGGLFLLTDKPLAVGKRIALEVHVTGEAGPWSALGRVVWGRSQPDSERRPPGMGVKLIDADDAVIVAIQRVVKAHERTEPGPTRPTATPTVGVAPIVVAATPSRERTLVGVGLVTSTPVSAIAPITAPPMAPGAPASPTKSPPPVAPAVDEIPVEITANREQSGRREPSVVIDLVSRDEEDEETLPPTRYEAPAVSRAPDEGRPRNTARWIAVLILLVVAGAAAYVILDGGLDRLLKPADNVDTPSRPAPFPPASDPTPPAQSAAPGLAPVVTATTSTSAPAPSSAAVPSTKSTSGVSASPGLSPAAPKSAPGVPVAPMTRAAGPMGPGPAAPGKRGSEDNPY